MEKEFWEQRWKDKTTGWDLGMVSPPLKDYFDQLQDKNLKILIPGCGNGYEAAYLYHQGFKNVFIIDIAAEAIESFKKTNPDFPVNQIIHGDFFEHHHHYDLIVEQTFFCAINPNMRKKYVEHMYEILKPSGKLVGLLFNREFEGGPPFSGNKKEYEELFQEKFDLKILETAYNSIEPRQGTELFFKFTPRQL